MQLHADILTFKMSSYEKARLRHKPKRIKLLMVGEAPPEQEQRFFYCKGRGLLGTATSKAFSLAMGKQFESHEEFLSEYSRRGCYLEDLFQEPMKVWQASQEQIDSAVEELANLIKSERPKVVVSCLKRIQRHVREAVARSGVEPEMVSLPFPLGRGRKQFVGRLSEVFRKRLR